MQQHAIHLKKHKIALFLFLISLAMASRGNTPLTNEPPSVGNFSLASSQQPGPFFSFGQNIINKNQWVASYNPSYFYSTTQSISEGAASLLYGFTDSTSALLTLPYAFNYRDGNQHVSGFGDLAIDLEYAFYSQENVKYSDQATIVFSPTIPISNLDKISKKVQPSSRVSGASRKNSAANFDAATYFIGTTYSRTLVDWYGFLAPGILYITPHHSIQQGTQYYYNFGMGHNIKSVEKKYIFSGLLELNGQYSDKTKLHSVIIPNTGGNIIYATPSIWISTPKLVFQIGISLPLLQYWYGNQGNISYYANGIISWTIG